MEGFRAGIPRNTLDPSQYPKPVSRSQALARMGATVTAVDAAGESVGVGRAHAARDPLVAARTTFRHVTAEELVAEGG